LIKIIGIPWLGPDPGSGTQDLQNPPVCTYIGTTEDARLRHSAEGQSVRCARKKKKKMQHM